MTPGPDAGALSLPEAAPAWRRIAAAARAGALAVLAAAAALGVTAALEGPLEGPFFFPSLGATVLVALYLGLGPSVLTIAVSALGHAALFLQPRGSLWIDRPADLLRLAGWAATALLVSWLVGRSQASTAAEREATRRLARAAASERRARELYQLLQAATVACSAARTFGEVAFALLESALTHLQPSAVNLAMVEEDGALRIVFSQGIPEAELSRFPAIPPGAALPAAECARARRIVAAVGDEIDRRYPELAELRASSGFESIASVPIQAGGRIEGVLGLAFAHARALDAEEREFLAALADQAGQAIARARSYDTEARARAEAERISSVKDQLLAVVGHDLRNPLSAIVNGLDLVFRRGGLTPRDAATLRRVAGSAARMSAVIRDLLDFSRLRQGLGLPVHPGDVDLAELTREVLAEFEERADPPVLELRAKGDLWVTADRQRLAQALSNLVGNAVQHGGGSAIRVELTPGPDAVVLSVHNGGPRIDPDVLPHLFEPFRRGRSRDGGRDTGSVGLGLFIVDAIVKAHGGTIAVASSEGAGSTFTVTLPRSAGGR